MNALPRPAKPVQPYGFFERFCLGDYARAEAALDAMRLAGASFLRTEVSWAQYREPGGEAWYDWLLPKIASRFELLTCIRQMPMSAARGETAFGASHRQQDATYFFDHVLTRYGRDVSALEFWSEPNHRIDENWLITCAKQMQERGIKPVLGGAFHAQELLLLGESGVLAAISAVGLHGVPGTMNSDADPAEAWNAVVFPAREILREFNPEAEIWITEAGYPTSRYDEAAQAKGFLQILAAPADRFYWNGWQDLPDDVLAQDDERFDMSHRHMGAVDAEGQPKLLARLLRDGGIGKLQETVRLATPSVAKSAKRIVIAGGAGFIGSNLAESFLSDGRDVLLLDNLSRSGVEDNVGWLKSKHGGLVEWHQADVRDDALLRDALQDAEAVFHLAAQVAVTTSIELPLHDFEVNARGTINVLEAVRRSGRKTPIIFASTNKVYGNLADLEMREQADRYQPADNEVAAHGIGETRGLDFCTPYGCSKGVADQYVLDYAKSFDLPTAVLRMSCIYGPRQFGTEDQGWVAHFLIRALENESLTIYGDGKQVRDILHVSDAVSAYSTLLTNINRVKGQAFNLGGGPANAVSLRMVLAEIARLVKSDLRIDYSTTRQGDQTYFVADTRKLAQSVGWTAKIGWMEGLRDLHAWLEGRNGREGARGASAPVQARNERAIA